MSQSDCYPRLRPAYRVIKTPDMGVLIESAERSVLEEGEGNVWVDADAVTVLEHCDGCRSVEAITQTLADTAQEASRIESFLAQMERLGCLDMATDPDAVEPDIRGNTAYYVPMHVSLELTDACNLSCDHCYRVSDPTDGDFIDYEDAVALIDGLAEAGTMGVELTGGEPTIHPQFVDILEHAGEQLDLVGVLTNGMAIDGTMLDRIESVADSTLVFFSISLDSHDPAFHNKFRGDDAAWSKTVEGIRAVTDRDFLTRVSMTVTPENVDHMEDLAAQALDLGASMFSFSPMLPFGRAESWYTWETDDIQRLADAQKAVMDQYGDRIPTIDMEGFLDRESAQGRNCGAGWKTVVVDPEGSVRPCVMADADRDTIGQLSFEDPEGFFEHNADVTQGFHDLVHPHEDVCGACPHFQFCSGCILRGRAAVECDFISESECSYPASERLEAVMEES